MFGQNKYGDFIIAKIEATKPLLSLQNQWINLNVL
jgi:hypothetical protein